MPTEPIRLTATQLKQFLDVRGRTVHTYTGVGPILVGVEWPARRARAVMAEHGAIPAGPHMAGMDHGVAVVGPDGVVTFFATKSECRAELAALRVPLGEPEAELAGRDSRESKP